MAVYTVHVPASGEVEHAVFLRDSFSMGAFLFGPLWLCFRGAWISGILLMVAILICVSTLMACGVSDGYLAVLSFLMMALLGNEGTSLIRLDLKLRKYSLAGVVTGDKPEDAEARFFASYGTSKSASVMPPVASSSYLPGSQHQPGILGSFPHPSSGSRAGT